MGHEFTSLVLALLQTGGHPPRAESHVVGQIKALEGELRFETFVSLSCHSCPDVVQALNLMAVLNPRIHNTMIDGTVFPEEIARREIMGVPAVFLNGQLFGQGRMELADMLAKLGQGGAQPDGARLSEEAPFDVLVVGGGNSGVEAAIDLAGIVSHVTVITHAQTTEVLGDGQRVVGLVYKDRGSGHAHTLELAGAFDHLIRTPLSVAA